MQQAIQSICTDLFHKNLSLTNKYKSSKIWPWVSFWERGAIFEVVKLCLNKFLLITRFRICRGYF